MDTAELPLDATKAAPEGAAGERLLLVASHPANLALLRICVGLALLNLLRYDQAWRFADLDDSLLKPPAGLGSLIAAMPRPAWFLVLGNVVLVACAVALVVGHRARLAAGVAAGLGLYVFGVSQLWGKVNHHHHLLWLLVILALSRCDDALTIHRRKRPEPSVRYGTPLRVAWVLMATVYLFPGIAKATTAGWAMSDNLMNTIAIKRWEKGVDYGFVPPEWFGRPAALATILFEIGFVFLVLTRWRRLFVVAGASFHIMTALTMGIQFRSMLLLYPALWAFWPDALPSDEDASRVRAPLAAGGVLFAGALLAGATFTTEGWPFACYPLFNEVRAEPTVVAFAVDHDGQELRVDDLWPDLGYVRAHPLAYYAWKDPDAMEDIADRLGPGRSEFLRLVIDVRTGDTVERRVVFVASGEPAT